MINETLKKGFSSEIIILKKQEGCRHQFVIPCRNDCGTILYGIIMVLIIGIVSTGISGDLWV